MSEKPRVDVRVDAATSGPCGTFTVLLHGDKREKWIDGPVVDRTTYTSQVLHGLLDALKALKKPCEVRVFTSCRHTVDSANGWVYGWAKKEWRTGSGEPVRDSKLWEEFLELKKIHSIDVYHDPHMGDIRQMCSKRAQARCIELHKIAAI